MPFLPEMALQHVNAVSKVYPEKNRKVGCSVGSKNKHKLEDVRPWKLGVSNLSPMFTKTRWLRRLLGN